MLSNEPMTLGSPQSPVSPGGHGQNQYLPAFLMGEPPSTVTSVSIIMPSLLCLCRDTFSGSSVMSMSGCL